MLQVDYGQDLTRVCDILAEIARDNPWSLDEPAPVILVSEFKESGIDVLLGLWFAKDDFGVLKNSIMSDIVARFTRERVRFAHPRRTLRVAKGAGSIA